MEGKEDLVVGTPAATLAKGLKVEASVVGDALPCATAVGVPAFCPVAVAVDGLGVRGRGARADGAEVTGADVSAAKLAVGMSEDGIPDGAVVIDVLGALEAVCEGTLVCCAASGAFVGRLDGELVGESVG